MMYAYNKARQNGIVASAGLGHSTELQDRFQPPYPSLRHISQIINLPVKYFGTTEMLGCKLFPARLIQNSLATETALYETAWIS